MQPNTPAFVSIETTAFSGATLLTFLLGSHPDIATVGEISGLIDRDDPETYLCSCGQRIKDCEFWFAVKAGMLARGHNFDVANFDMKFDFGGPYLARRFRNGSFRNRYLDTLHDKILFSLPTEKQRFTRMVERNSAFIQTVLQVTGKKVFLDSSKSRLRVRAFRRFTDMDIQVIHLVRRAEGVVASHVKRIPEADLRTLAQDWKQRHRRLNASYQHWPKERYIRVRYEDICLNTDRVLAQLFDYLGLRNDIQDLDFQTTSQHVIGNPMRLRPLSDIQLDERWKQELTPDQITSINQAAGELNRLFGYPEYRNPR